VLGIGTYYKEFLKTTAYVLLDVSVFEREKKT
jgi:hypothetical protein